MDTLEVQYQADAAAPANQDALILVKYQNFYQGRHDKVVKS
jgi:hypothetical protein